MLLSENKGTDQTAWMPKLVCAFVVCKHTKTGFLASMAHIIPLFFSKLYEDLVIHHKKKVLMLFVSNKGTNQSAHAHSLIMLENFKDICIVPMGK